MDCVGSWTPFGPCSAECGGGTTTRSFTIAVPAAFGGAECEAADGDTESELCNEQACPAEVFDSLAGYLGQLSGDAEKERLLFALGTFWSIALEDGQELVDHTLLDLAAAEAGLELGDVFRTVQDMLDASTI